MAIVSFWSSRKRETNQSTSAIASALQMGIDRNLKILLIDTNYADRTYDKCFNKQEADEFIKTLNKGKLDISSGVEGLMLAVNSNKSSPEIIQNYTQPILTGRLDLLNTMNTKNKDQYIQGYVNYPDIVEMANNYYDVVIVDLPKGFGDKVTTKILAMSDIIVTTFDQDIELISDFERIWGNDPLFSPKQKVIPLLTKEDRFSALYNNNNVARMIKMYPGMPSLLYNTQLMEAVQRGDGAKFFIDINMSTGSRNKMFLDTLVDLNTLLIDRIQQQKYNMTAKKPLPDDIIRNHVAYMSKEKLHKEEEKEEQERENVEEGNLNPQIPENIEKQEPIMEQKIPEENLNQNAEQMQNFEQNQNNFQSMKEIGTEEVKENKKEGVLDFIKNIFKPNNKKEAKNENENKFENINQEPLKNNAELEKQQNGNVQEESQIQNNLEQNKEQKEKTEQKNSLMENIDQMSMDAAKNISNAINEDVNKISPDSAISDAEKIMEENKALLQKLENKTKEEENKKSSLDFSGIKPLNKEDNNKNEFYSSDSEGNLNTDSNLLDKNLDDMNKKFEEKSKETKIDFSKIKPLSEEKGDIELKQSQKIQEELKNKILNSENNNQVEIKQNEPNEQNIEKHDEQVKEEQQTEEKKEEAEETKKTEEQEEVKETQENKEEKVVFNPILGIVEEDTNEEEQKQQEEKQDKKPEQNDTIDNLI